MSLSEEHARPEELFDETSALSYALERGLTADESSHVSALSGGVSNLVFLIESTDARFVLKQARGKLDVADDWFADPGRARSEASAIKILQDITPDRVPHLLDIDTDRNVIAITAAPSSWRSWKDLLLEGECEPAVAVWLGTTLAEWHSQTLGKPLPEELNDVSHFRELRLHPYFDVSVQRRPDLAPLVNHYVAEVSSRSRCLISGDFSPKNVLVGRDGYWVIDFEVACCGDPDFDVAFMLTHLVLKAVHLPATRDALRECCEGFLGAYCSKLAIDDPTHLYGVLASLLLARVVGSSPVDYLTPGEASYVEFVAGHLLSSTPTSLSQLWTVVFP
jgi:aminoglycoside phosphotransferase (APT) family kinase protein